MNELITQINDAIWGYVLIGGLIICGIWFTWKTKGVQFRMVGEMLRLLADSATSGTDSLSDKDKNHKHISSFQAFAVSVATRVGTGNLAGVATAIAIGGPGAVFWMWVIALIGSATAFMILISGLYSTPDLNGIALTQAALNSEIGAFGPTFIAIAILLFAFSSIIGNYYYGEANIRFMTSSNAVLTVYRVLSGGVLGVTYVTMYPDPDVTLGCKDIEKYLVVSQKVSIFATEKY